MSADPLLEEIKNALARGRAGDAESLSQRLVEANPKNAAAWHQLGLARHKLGRPADAVQAFVKASTLDRNVARYHHDLASALVDDGKSDRAITSFRRALRIDDTLAESHNDLGTAYFEKRWYAEAEASFRRAIALKPDHGIAHANLGATLRAQGNLQEGRRAYQRALGLKIRGLLPRFLQWKVAGPALVARPTTQGSTEEISRAMAQISQALLSGRRDEAARLAADADARYPGQPDIHYLAAIAHEESARPQEALAHADAAIALKFERAEYHVLRARLLATAGDQDEALKATGQALLLEPGSADAHAVLASIYRTSQQFDLAEATARKGIEFDPDAHAAHANLAAVLWVKGDLADAEKYAREALRLAPKGLHYPINLAVILKDAGKLDEARRIYLETAARTPDHQGILLNLGTLALECEVDLDGARRWYARCLALGDDPRAVLSESIVDLLEERYAAAWPKYEARKQVAGHRERHLPFREIPVWSGETLDSERLLISAEQGLGDEIMLASMFGEVRERVKHLELTCEARLAALFARSFPGVKIHSVPTNAKPVVDPVPERVIAAGSLGMIFRRSAKDFPAHRGYLVPDPQKVAVWRERLDELGPHRKIGISWIGGTWATGRARRSLTLEQLRPLLETPEIAWISLQYGNCAGEIEAFAAASGIRVHAFQGVADDMDELAALIKALDLVVSVCNTAVHVAGAIGKDVLVMSPRFSEWRYGLHGERMAWYPSARVFRQPSFGDWGSVISRVKGELLRA